MFSILGSGVKDFFYEPAAGMVRGPGHFVKGLGRGTESLVKNSVYGTFNAASKLTGSISSGLANLSMDKSYIHARTSRKVKDVPTNVGAGLLLGTKQLGQVRNRYVVPILIYIDTCVLCVSNLWHVFIWDSYHGIMQVMMNDLIVCETYMGTTNQPYNR
jgi:hypothetical protein